MKQSRLAKVGVTSAALLGVAAMAFTGASAANADPTTPTDYRTYAAVGSDTIQDVYNALTNGTGAASPTIASWNAFPTSTITTKAGGNAFARPAGSGAGVLALSKSVNPASDHLYDNGAGSTVSISNQVNIARSSSGPATAGSDLAYIPFARDAVSFAVRLPLGKAATVNATLTAAQLKSIYECTTTSITLSDGSSLAVTPRLPQPSSGTRSFFLKAIGAPTLGSCVGEPSTLPENDGSALSNTGYLIPFSAAQWIAQKNGAASNTITSLLRIGNISDGTNTLVPTAGTAPALTPGTLYGSASTVPATTAGTFARDTYSVIPQSAVGSGTPVGLEDAVTTKFATTAAQATITKFGFLNLSYLDTLDRSKYKGAAFTG